MFIFISYSMDLDTILNIMAKYNLTADELLLIYLTFLAQTENSAEGDIIKTNKIYFQKWYQNGGKERLRSLFTSLKEKGIIKKNYNPSVYDPDEIEFSKNFINQYFKLSGELGQELMNEYPSEIWIDGKLAFLNNVSKQFKNVFDFYFWYSKTIGHSIEKHHKIMDTLRWAKHHDLIQISMIEFVASHKWDYFEKLRKEGLSGQVTTSETYETV